MYICICLFYIYVCVYVHLDIYIIQFNFTDRHGNSTSTHYDMGIYQGGAPEFVT